MEPKKASDILIEVQTKLDLVLDYVKSQDFNMKLLSNKLNALIENKAAPKLTIEAVNIADALSVPVNQEASIETDLSPKGFRRTSRQESFVNKLPVEEKINTDIVVQAVPLTPVVKPAENPSFKDAESQNSVPVHQRVVDKNSKAIFLADVEITDLKTMKLFYKTRTNGMGKWMTSLPHGIYRVVINKRESVTKESLSSSQEIKVDGSSSPLELPIVIIRK